MGKHILFISYDGMTDPLGQSQVIPYLAGLTRYGYTFTILSADKPDRYQAHQAYVQSLLQSYPIQWVSVPYHKNPPIISSWLDYRTLKKKALQFHRQKPFDMVHTRPGIPTLVALQLVKKLGIRFLNDIRGFWADERVDGGMWNQRNPLFKWIYRYFKRHEAECLQKADYNVCLTYAARQEILSWKQIPNQPVNIEVIPCSADLQLFDPANVNAELRATFQQKLGIQEADIVISYLGSIGSWYMSNEMLHFCKLVSDRLPNARFLFISPQDHHLIQTAATNAGLPLSKLMIQAAQRHEVPALLSLSSYSLFFIKPCYSKLSSSPTKHGEIMAMGIPVITNAGVGDVAAIVSKYQSGWVIDPLETATMEQVADRLAAGSNWNASAIRKGAEEWYALEQAIARYKKVYDQIFLHQQPPTTP